MSLTKRREIEHLRDVIFRGVGTDEPLIEQDLMEMAGELGIPHWQIVTRQWRKPLSIPEISRMAPTPEVRERRGRP